ncbi:hypothetical protein QBC39DRAFT_434038 [Podospora conica]|nr:hypothetical protein QBC39DRAFT_434038 [Schizothecium conicum]
MFPTTLVFAIIPLLRVCSGAVTCLPVGRTATATWKTDTGVTCTWTGVVGSNFGFNAIGSDTQDCFSHDICSYFNRATGGSSDPNCGNAFDAAVDDTAFGAIRGCGQTNPSLPASPPTTWPSCSS